MTLGTNLNGAILVEEALVVGPGLVGDVELGPEVALAQQGALKNLKMKYC